MRTLAPSITWANSGADSGDLATAAYLLGIAHPPGYPAYVLFGKLFTLIIPFAEAAYRVNVMSAFFAALASVLVYFTVLEILPLTTSQERRPPRHRGLLSATIAALAMAFSPVFWSQATIAEVYTLNASFVAGICYLVVRWRRDGPFWLLTVATFLLGVGVGNHPTLLLIAPGALFLLLRRRAAIGWGTLASMVASFLLGASVYVLLPLRADDVPSLTWDDPTSLQGFLNTVFAAPYRRYFLTLPLQYLPQRVSALAALLGGQFSWLGLAIGLIGAGVLWQRERNLTAFTLSPFALTAVYATLYNTVDSYLYLIPGFLIMAVWLGVGAMAAAERLEAAWRGAGSEKREARVRRPLPASRFPLLLLLAIPGLSLVTNYATLDLSGDTAARDYAAEVFQLVEPGAIVIADTDAHITSLWYYRYVLRPDSGVAVVVGELLPYDAYLEGLLRRDPSLLPPAATIDPSARLAGLIRANLGHRPIYLTGTDLSGGRFKTRQVGPVYRVEEG
ncbi:MAG: DUF2723 domain-containing protein [Chloroflexi bacterium]|nr:DUF2723 domain-containing protein [Chloroflexota bacterium]